jgi:hypothetical protein
MVNKKNPEADATAEFMIRLFSDVLQNEGLEDRFVGKIMDIVVSGTQMPEMMRVDTESLSDISSRFPAVFGMDADKIEKAREGLSDSYGTCFIAAGLSIRNFD